MAVAVQEARTSVDFVTEAVLAVHRAHVDAATEMSLAEFLDSPVEAGAVRAIVADGARFVEIVLDEDTHIDLLAEVAWELDERAWLLNVIVSLNRLGEAHTALRGAPCTLQGWWFDDDAVRFAGFERP
ncbi:MAG: hypothetical protein BMS9Abin12_1065 [Acidimicrobiia bacterium]|nr:MAG: hypothetical protein BMS9Abin12_1065 [Acidimicrobiia bacterium]